MRLETHFRSWTTGLPQGACIAIQHAGASHNVSPAMILSGSHERPIAQARRQAIGDLFDRGYSPRIIGGFLGLHRTSVLHHLKKLGKATTQSKRAQASNDLNIPVPDESGVWI